MTDEERTELEFNLRDLRAKNAVLELVQTQLMMEVATLFENPTAFVRLVMTNAEENLLRARKKATDENAEQISDAIEAMNNYSMRLIAGMTPEDSPQ